MNKKYHSLLLFSIGLALFLLVGIFFFEKGENLGRVIATPKTVEIRK